ASLVEKCVLEKKGNIARVELLGLVEVRLALVPLASPPGKIGEQFGNPAAIGQKLTSLLKVTHCGVVILEAGVVIKALSQYGLAQVGLKSEPGVSCLPSLLPHPRPRLNILC